MEVLHIPLNRHMRFVESLQESQGRFFAVGKKFFDRATLLMGTRVPMVGKASWHVHYVFG